MTTPEFQIGDLVDITVKGVRVLALGSATVTIGVAEHEAQLPMLCTEVTHAVPPEWPPQRADLWRDREGLLWAAMYRHNEARAPFIELEPTDGRRAPLADRNEWLRRERGPLTLVYREQRDGGGAS